MWGIFPFLPIIPLRGWREKRGCLDHFAEEGGEFHGEMDFRVQRVGWESVGASWSDGEAPDRIRS